jgi:hypothetical protein
MLMCGCVYVLVSYCVLVLVMCTCTYCVFYCVYSSIMYVSLPALSVLPLNDNSVAVGDNNSNNSNNKINL